MKAQDRIQRQVKDDIRLITTALKFSTPIKLSEIGKYVPESEREQYMNNILFELRRLADAEEFEIGGQQFIKIKQKVTQNVKT